ncbi:MAG: translation initiation factor IF-2, partial [Bacteroidia bacterium]|nr:translation initiation factor IF-2 [Bacteroidia bacterium]
TGSEKPAAKARAESVKKREKPTPVATSEPTVAATETASEAVEEVIRAKDHTPKLEGLKIVGKIELPFAKSSRKDSKEKDPKEAKEKEPETPKKPERTSKPVFTTKAPHTVPPGVSSAGAEEEKTKRKRKRKSALPIAETPPPARPAKFVAGVAKPTTPKPPPAPSKAGQKAKDKEVSNKQVQDKVRKTLAEISKAPGRQRQLIRRDKRAKRAGEREQMAFEEQARESVLEVTEYLTANELANLMDVPVNEVIAKCMELGLFVSINQRIEADVISLIAEEFGFKVKFLSVEESFALDDDEDDDPELLEPRAPIVTVMGHVDHGKTSLLDYIRKTNVTAAEAGGITQHIGAYEVKLPDGRKITFLDTPGHEAFTAMRARGAQVTDVAIIVIAADDQVMPQTREAINHAQAAGVPMVFAINKIDKPGADPDKILLQLSMMNIFVEGWGGNVQWQAISAKHGTNVDLLLEKVLLEAEILDLKANPHCPAKGTVIEAQLDKGRGVVATVLVQKGTLRVGDVVVANCHYGKIKALIDDRGKRIKSAGPAQPVQILGLDGVPQAGDKFYVVESEREAREIATRRQQLMREQSLRMHKHITLEEIARRSAVGDFKELNVILKGDVDGSVEALADSLIRLSTDEVALRIVHKGVGQITESDVLLASASNAIIVGFQVRPSPNARKLAQQESIDIRIYSIIYEAIEEIKSAIEGMLAPKIEEEVVGVAEVRETFKIQKVGVIAGCMVVEGKITRGASVRVIRDGVVVYTGKIESLRRFKDDVKEVVEGFECGVGVENFNDIKVGDLIEAFVSKEVKRTLS